MLEIISTVQVLFLSYALEYIISYLQQTLLEQLSFSFLFFFNILFLSPILLLLSLTLKSPKKTFNSSSIKSHHPLSVLHNQTVKSFSKAGSFNLGTLDVWGQIILCCRSCPVYCRMFSIPSLYLLSISNISLQGIFGNI